MNRVFAIAALSAACATTPATKPAERPPAGPLPAPMTVLPLRLSPDAALLRARVRIEAQGYTWPAEVRPEKAGARADRGVARANRVLRRSLEAEPSCVGSAEIVQISATVAGSGSELRVACYTARLSAPTPGGAECRQVPQAGCPEGGDRLVGEVALDAISQR